MVKLLLLEVPIFISIKHLLQVSFPSSLQYLLIFGLNVIKLRHSILPSVEGVFIYSLHVFLHNLVVLLCLDGAHCLRLHPNIILLFNIIIFQLLTLLRQLHNHSLLLPDCFLSTILPPNRKGIHLLVAVVS